MNPISFATYLSPNYEPLYRHLAQQIAQALGSNYQFRVGTDISEFEQTEADLVFACGWWYIQRPHLYEPLLAPVMLSARYANLPVYFVDLVSSSVRPVKTINQLAGKIFGFNEEYSFSGYQALVSELEKTGQSLDNFAQIVKTGSHLNSLEALLKAEIDCAALDSTVLDFELKRKPELKEKLFVTASFGPYPAPPLLVRKNLRAEIKEAIIALIMSLPTTSFKPFGIKEYREVNSYFYSGLSWLAHQVSQSV